MQKHLFWNSTLPRQRRLFKVPTWFLHTDYILVDHTYYCIICPWTNRETHLTYSQYPNSVRAAETFCMYPAITYHHPCRSLYTGIKNYKKEKRKSKVFVYKFQLVNDNLCISFIWDILDMLLVMLTCLFYRVVVHDRDKKKDGCQSCLYALLAVLCCCCVCDMLDWCRNICNQIL